MIFSQLASIYVPKNCGKRICPGFDPVTPLILVHSIFNFAGPFFFYIIKGPEYIMICCSTLFVALLDHSFNSPLCFQNYWSTWITDLLFHFFKSLQFNFIYRSGCPLRIHGPPCQAPSSLWLCPLWTSWFTVERYK